MPRNVELNILRGTYANMPTLGDGEFYFATDQYQLYVGLNGDSLPVGGTMAVQLADKYTPSQLAVVYPDGSLLVNTGLWKSLVMKTGSLVSTSTTANQGILGYTVTTGKTFYLTYVDIQGRLTTPATTNTYLGLVTLSLAGVSMYQAGFSNPTTGDSGSQSIRITFSEPLPISSATTILVTATPAVATSTTWIANFGGYER